jgi:hypothetical protein
MENGDLLFALRNVEKKSFANLKIKIKDLSVFLVCVTLCVCMCVYVCVHPICIQADLVNIGKNNIIIFCRLDYCYHSNGFIIIIFILKNDFL